MKRSSILKLNQEVWVYPIENDPLEVAVVPSEASVLAGQITLPASVFAHRVCSTAFTNFRGYYEDDGKTLVPNTLKARLELYAALPVFRAVNDKLAEAGEVRAEGEESADSD